MKLSKIKLSHRIWLFLILFTVLILLFVSVFQVLFLENYYQAGKINTLQNFGNELTENIEDEIEFAKITSKCEEAGIKTYISDGQKICYPYYYVDKDVKNYSEWHVIDSAIEQLLISSKEYIVDIFTDKIDAVDVKSFYFIKMIRYEGSSYYLVLISSLDGLEEMVRVVQTQFLTIILIIIPIGIFLSWYFSVILSNPLNQMSNTAKKWAEGDNSVNFVGKGYKEIIDLADALNYAKEGVSKADILQKDLLSNISHDLRTPLTMIIAYAEMIKDFSYKDQVKREKHLKVIKDEADRLTLLVHDILNLSKLQASMDQLELKKVNLSELTNTVIDRFESFIENKGISINCEIQNDLYSDIDEKKIEQVIYNLIGNAINYTGKNKEISVYLKSNSDDITLEIVDSGKGISRDNINTIWQKYYRASDTNTRTVKGTGLGLSIVKAILEAHNIKYGVISKKNVGSNFFVVFKNANLTNNERSKPR